MKYLSLAVLLLIGMQASCVAPNATKSRAQAGFGCDDSMNGTLEALAPWMIGTAALGGLSYAATPEPNSAGGVGYDSYDEFFPTVGLLATAGLGIWLTAEVLVSGVNALDCSDHLKAHGFDRPLTAEEIRAVEKKIRFVKPESKTESDRERRRRERKERIAKARAERRQHQAQDQAQDQAAKPWSERAVVSLDKLSVEQHELFEKVQSCDEIVVPKPDHALAGSIMWPGVAGTLQGAIMGEYMLMGGGLILAISSAFLYFSADSAYQKSIAQRKAECDTTRNLWMTELEILRAEQGLPPDPNQGAAAKPEPSQDPVETEEVDDDATENGILYDAPVIGADEDRDND